MSPFYPWFARSAYAWLLISALLQWFGAAPGMTGASRHAFTVGFLAMLILSIGPRILPSFLNSRELYSPRLVSVSLFLLTVGCALRVTSEPLAYAGVLPAAWTALPFSAILEMSAILLFAWNIGWTLVSPMPAWIELRLVNGGLSLYWLISSYPETRNVLRSAGLSSIGRVEEIPRSLTLQQVAEAQGAPTERLVSALREYFERRMAAVLKSKAGPPAPPQNPCSTVQ